MGADSTEMALTTEGPAPRPLERVKITLAEDGQIEIDKSVKFLGEKDQWGDLGAFLKV